VGVKIHNVAVIGAGVLGRRLAAMFAVAGYVTVLEDILPSNLRKAAEVLSGVVEQTVVESVAGKVRLASSVEDAVRTADLIVDCVPDELESKLEIFSLLDRMAPPRAVLATPTRGLSIADLASCTYRADRCIALQLPDGGVFDGGIVVLTSTSQTLTEVLDSVAGVWERCGLEVERRLDPSEASVASGTLF
jgi:3-hydroxybutyryl-CoA dehydrogenase